MSKSRRRPAPATKADARAEVARLERRVRSLERQLATSEGRADDAMRESGERQRALAEARNQLAATAEVVRVISGSPTDPQPVFDAIAESAVTLCDATFGIVFRFDGQRLHFVAQHRLSGDTLALIRSQYPIAPRGFNALAIDGGAPGRGAGPGGSQRREKSSVSSNQCGLSAWGRVPEVPAVPMARSAPHQRVARVE